MEGLRVQRRRLARVLRELCAELVTNGGPDEIFGDAADTIEAVVARLKVEPRLRRSVARNLEEEIREEGGLFHYGELMDFSPLAGLANPVAPPVQVRKEGAGGVSASVRFSAAYQGGPGVVHGGYLAAAFDEMLGLVQCLTGKAGMTASLRVRYRNPCPIETNLRMVGRVHEVKGRRILAKGEMYAGERLVADAEGMFVIMDPEHYVERLSIAGAWRRGKVE